jgi:2-aminobenzoate-CoA ligase
MSTHGLPEVEYPMRLNAAEELLDSHIAQGHGSNPCLRTGNFTWTYQQVLDHANRMANLLVKWGLAPGERVLLRDANTPMLVASWFAVLKAGGIAVTTMVQLRAHELTAILNKARTKYAVCAREHAEDVYNAQGSAPVLEKIICYDNPTRLEIPALLADQSDELINRPT